MFLMRGMNFLNLVQSLFGLFEMGLRGLSLNSSGLTLLSFVLM